MPNQLHTGLPARRQVLFIQGAGERVHDEWDNKLVESLRLELGPDYEVHYPRMPNEADPQYADWKIAIEQQIGVVGDHSILVGHSIGASMLVNVLAERSAQATIGALILISAPYLGDGGWVTDELHAPKSLGEKLPRNVPIHVFHGLKDSEVPPQHADLYQRAIPRAKVHRVADRDHQFNNDLRDVAEAIKSL